MIFEPLEFIVRLSAGYFASYQANTENNDFTFGDEYRLDASFNTGSIPGNLAATKALKVIALF